ncbi:MAG: hypothetical protein MJZ94_03740 [Bacteroidales bacterium]|nr:hypothetical protein [Bacteroidales bacterium]
MAAGFTYGTIHPDLQGWECQTSTGVGAREWTGYGEAPAMCVGPVSPSLNFCNFSFKRKVNETRMYDPVMSSFLSVDAYVQSPDNSQNFNRYAYCLNNPLRYTDPSGWFYQGGHSGSSLQGPYECQWNSPLEPRDLGLRQLPDGPNPDILWMEANEQKGGGGGETQNGFFDSYGKYIGSDGKYEGKIYVVYNVKNDKEKVPRGESYKDAVTFIKQNDGKYGGSIENLDVVYKSAVGSPMKEDIIIELPANCSTYHSHPSGTIYKQIGGNVGGADEFHWYNQFPSITDISNAGNFNHFVIGMGGRNVPFGGYVYGYNASGTHIQISIKTFTNPNLFKLP